MQFNFSGRSYFYKVFSYEKESLYYFSIVAVHKSTRRTSFITTSNFVLSIFEIRTDENRFWESEWSITKDELRHFMDRFRNCVKYKYSLTALEKFLDQDRLEGEWENNEQ